MWYSPLCTGTSISSLLTPAVYLSKAFTVLLAPILHCHPPPTAPCQMPALDMVHHCAGVSKANCHLFFSLHASHGERERKAQKHARNGQSCQTLLEIIKAYTCWRSCNISIVSDAATSCYRGIWSQRPGLYLSVCISIPHVFVCHLHRRVVVIIVDNTVGIKPSFSSLFWF